MTKPPTQASSSSLATVDSALAAYLDRLSPVAGLPATHALTALAFAETPGLPAGLWQLAVRSHLRDAYQHRRPDPVRPVLGGQLPGGNRTRRPRPTFPGAGSPVYRLFHQALNDALLRARADITPRSKMSER